MTTADELTQKVDRLREALRRKQLSAAALDQLDKEIEQVEETLEALPDKPRRSIVELDGLGKELWRSIDSEAYLERERDSWR
jgi:Tfp pilus assembly protein PilO